MILFIFEFYVVLCVNVDCFVESDYDFVLVVKFFNLFGVVIWFVIEFYDDGDMLLGLVDFGFGCFEFGCFSLFELVSICLFFGFGIECDIGFLMIVSLLVWVDIVCWFGLIQ